MRCGSFRTNGRTFYRSFISLPVLVRLRVLRCKNSPVECDVPSERREAFPSGGGRYSLRAMANRLRFLHWFTGFGSPSSFALQNSLVWSLFFRTVYGFFIGLSVLVRPEFCCRKARWWSRFFCEPSMGLSSVCRFRFAFLFAGGNRPDKVRQFSGETWA